MATLRLNGQDFTARTCRVYDRPWSVTDDADDLWTVQADLAAPLLEFTTPGNPDTWVELTIPDGMTDLLIVSKAQIQPHEYDEDLDNDLYYGRWLFYVQNDNPPPDVFPTLDGVSVANTVNLESYADSGTEQQNFFDARAGGAITAIHQPPPVTSPWSLIAEAGYLRGGGNEWWHYQVLLKWPAPPPSYGWGVRVG